MHLSFFKGFRMIMRKSNDKTLTKVVGDENHYGCTRLCGQQHKPCLEWFQIEN